MRHLRLLTDQPAVTTDTGLLALRLAIATVFIAHGWGDVFDAGVSNNVENYRDAGIPLPEVSAYYTAYLQLVGGVLLAFGALSRPLSVGFVVAMAGALIYVHRGEPLAIQPDGSGFGFAFIMGVASLVLLLLGPGRFSVDHVLASRRARSGRSVDSPGAPSMRTGTTQDLAR
ncbi:MAG: DoxX family protein [Solirubrobacteraceae bacterium]